MGHSSTIPGTRHPYHRFGVAVTIYVMGAVGLSAWAVFARQGQDAVNSSYAVIENLRNGFLLAMGATLILLYRRARRQSALQAQALQAKHSADFEKIRKHELELEDAIRDLERFNALATGREERIIELKTEVNELLQEMNQPERYSLNPSS